MRMHRTYVAVAVIALLALAAFPAAAEADAPPLRAVALYWSDIGAGEYAPAYALLVPGTIGLTGAQFVAAERGNRIKSVEFQGSVAASTNSSATVRVSLLRTVDAAHGCRLWTGSYSVVLRAGQWLIARGDITPHACATSTTPKPAPSRGTILDVHDLDGNELAVSAQIFADPATAADEFAEAPAGSRLVAIRLFLKGLGPDAVSDDVNSDTTIVGNNGQIYTPSFDSVQGCTNFDYPVRLTSR
jgi:hypothetical protein